jgi:hypothetical protein
MAVINQDHDRGSEHQGAPGHQEDGTLYLVARLRTQEAAVEFQMGFFVLDDLLQECLEAGFRQVNG